MIFMLYRQSIPFARFLFAMADAEQCIGQQVQIDGWFRRGLRPYVEMSRLETEHGAVHRAYSRWVQYARGWHSALLWGCSGFGDKFPTAEQPRRMRYG